MWAKFATSSSLNSERLTLYWCQSVLAELCHLGCALWTLSLKRAITPCEPACIVHLADDTMSCCYRLCPVRSWEDVDSLNWPLPIISKLNTWFYWYQGQMDPYWGRPTYMHRPVASHPGGGGLNLDGWNTGANTGFPEGGGEDIHKTPLGHCPRDVIRPPENWKTPPLLDIHKHPPPPWTLPVWRHLHSKGGGWSVPVTHTLHRFSVLGQVQGGGDHPCHPPPPGSATGTLYTWYGWAVYIMAETRSLAPIAVDG